MSRGSSSTWRTRALAALVLLFVGLVVFLFVSSRSSSSDDAAPAQGAATTSKHAQPLARVAGGEQDPNIDPAELVLALHGRVVDSERRPVPGAEVELLYRPAGGAEARVDGRGGIVRSDANGAFVIPQLRAGTYRIEARKDDAVSATVEVALSARSTPVTLILVPAATMNVRVVSASDERPIAGALVRVAPGNSELGPVDASREGRTDTLGIARITGINPVTNHGVYAEAPGYAGAMVNVLAGANPDRQGWTATLRLRPGGVVTGRVVDSRGRPVSGAGLRWYTGETAKEADRASGLFSYQQGILRLGTARSGADGRFRLSAEVGPGLLEAAHPSHRVGFARGVVVAGGELALDVVVEDGASIAGVVLDDTGNAVPGAEVIVTKRGMSHQQMFMDGYRFRATTDRYGEFAFTGLDRDTFSLAAWSSTGSSELADLDLRTTPEQTGIVLELTRTGRIDGVVVEGDGKPAPYAQVTFFVLARSVTPPAGASADSFVSALNASPRAQGVVITGEDGRFSITGLVDGEYQLAARRASATSVAPIFGEARKDKVRPGQDVTLMLPALGSISGRVVGDDGAPVPGATVAAAYWQGDTSYPPGKLIGGDGRFKLAEVPAGRYGIKIAGANVIEWSSREGYDVVAGKDTDAGAIRVSRGVARNGIVVDRNGAPFPNAQVLVQLGLDATARTFDDVSDDRGRFDVPPLPPTTILRVRAYTPEMSSDWQTIGPDVTSIKIVLAPGATGTVSGLVVAAGEPVEKRTVLLTLDSATKQGTPVTDPNQQKSRGHTITEPGGRFLFKDVAVGHYRLWVRRASERGPEWTAHAEPIVVQAGKEVTVVVQVAQPQ